jgi:two-component sensor histidine kinase
MKGRNLNSKIIYPLVLLLCFFTSKAQVNNEEFLSRFPTRDLRGKIVMLASLSPDSLQKLYPVVKDSLESLRKQVYEKSSSREARFFLDVIDANLARSDKNYAKAVYIINNTLSSYASNVADSLRCYVILKHSFSKIRNFIKAYEINSKMEKLWSRKPDSLNLDYGISKSGLYASLNFMQEAVKERRLEFERRKSKLNVWNYASFYNDLGVYFNKLKLADSAAGYFLIAGKILDTAHINPEEKNHLEFFKALVKGNLGSSYYNKGQIDKAIPLLRQDIYYSMKFNHFESAFNSYRLMVDCYMGLKQPAIAKKYLDSAASIVNKHLKDITPRINYLYLASQFYQLTGEYKAANNCFIEYFKLKDSVAKIESQQSLLNSEIAFKIEEKEQELANKNSMLEQKELEEARQKTSRAYMIAGIIALVCLVVFLVLINYFSKRREKELYAKNEEINRQKSQIEQSLREKEVLIREIHHRVKNNLQIITSMLGLQISKEEGKESENILREARQRISSIALTHQMLYQNSNLSDILLDEYVENLVRQIESSIPPKDIQLITELENNKRKMNIDNAVPLGLLINELLTNSFKHAFPNNERGVIKVTLKETDTDCVLGISDNGVGLPDDFNSGKKSMGMDLIHILAEQLDAKLSIESKNGSSFVLVIPKSKFYL